MGLALKCTSCGAASVSSLFYLGPDAHVCRLCGQPFELADPRRDRRDGIDRRLRACSRVAAREWRRGQDRRREPI